MWLRHLGTAQVARMHGAGEEERAGRIAARLVTCGARFSSRRWAVTGARA